MQEKKEPVFVVATANDISQLPPELLRKGRFDEIFFVDLPSAKERENIFEIHLSRKNRDIKQLNIQLDSLSKATEGFSGSEIEEVVNEALFTAFTLQQNDLTEADILNCIREIYPLSTTMSETIENLRKWAEKRARMASGELPAKISCESSSVPKLYQEYYSPFIGRKGKDEPSDS
jgi:SpoVK/Ycf46/Vps4 family AAA+-type ATPase